MTCEVALAAAGLDGQEHECGHVELSGVRAPLEARRYIRERLAGLPAEVVDVALLLASEVVTNGVLHGRTHLRFGLSRLPTHVLITVADGNDALPRDPTMPMAQQMALSGRGMGLIAELAERYGWDPLPDSPGKVVWFTLRSDGSAAS